MNYSLPYWMLVLQALAVPAIGLLAAVIGYFQWKTAQQDRRMATYTALREIVAMVGASSSAATPDNSFKFLEALDRAEFLFGAKVIEHLQKIRQAIDDIHDMATERKDLQPGPELIANVAKERAAREVVGSFYTTFQALVRPYIRNASEVILVALRKKAAAGGLRSASQPRRLQLQAAARCRPSATPRPTASADGRSGFAASWRTRSRPAIGLPEVPEAGKRPAATLLQLRSRHQSPDE